MKDCILSVLWPRQAIFGFLRDNGFTTTDLNPIRNFKADQIPRNRLVESAFENLTSRPDGGLGQFRAMLKSLTEWSHFDPYYFDSLRKLDRAVAERNLDHLKQLVELRDSKIKTERQRREAETEKKQSTDETLQSSLRTFLDYGGEIKRQERGYKLESLLQNWPKLNT